MLRPIAYFLSFLPISTHFTNKSIISFLKSDHVGIFVVMGVALIFLTVKGTGATEIVAGVFHDTVQNTSASGAALEPALNQMLELNSLSGVGFEPRKLQDVSITIIQENAVLPHNAVLAMIVEDGKDDRTETSNYEVQPGDVLSSIAADFGLTVQTLISANNIKNINALSPGMELKIPAVDGILYKVKAGDTVSTLARKYQAESEKIISFNSLPLSGDLKIGDEIIIPDGVAPKQSARTQVATKNLSNLRFSALPRIENYFMTPATCVITQLFHVRNGIDCANKKGTPIYASAAGTVNLVQYSNKGYGNMVRITHSNGTETLYGHFGKIFVKTGDTVSQGQPIGEMGNTGYSTGPHIHFEIHGAYNILAKYGMRGQVTAGR